MYTHAYVKKDKLKAYGSEKKIFDCSNDSLLLVSHAHKLRKEKKTQIR